MAPYMRVGKRYLKNRILDFQLGRDTKTETWTYHSMSMLPFGEHLGQRWSSDGTMAVSMWPAWLHNNSGKADRLAIDKELRTGCGYTYAVKTDIKEIYKQAMSGRKSELAGSGLVKDENTVVGIAVRTVNGSPRLVHVFDAAPLAACVSFLGGTSGLELTMKQQGQSAILGLRRGEKWAICMSLMRNESVESMLLEVGMENEQDQFNYSMSRLTGSTAKSLSATPNARLGNPKTKGSTAQLDLAALLAQAKAKTGRQQAKPRRSTPRASSQQAIRAEIASLRDQQREAALEGMPHSVVMDLMREETDLRERLKPTRRAAPRPRERAEVKKAGKDSWKALTQARDAVVASGNKPGETWPDHFVKQSWLNVARTVARRLGKELGATTKVSASAGGPAVDGEVWANYTSSGRNVEVIFGTTDLGILVRRAEKVGKSTRWGMHHWVAWSSNMDTLIRAVRTASTDPWG